MFQRFIYLDHAATTPVHPKVLEAMIPYFSINYGNPSSIYSIARTARGAIEDARDKIASILGASNPSEIIFTSGGTESDNLAVKGIALANQKKGKHIITSSIEHHAVLHTMQFLEKQGFQITYLPVDKCGIIDLDFLKASITPQTILISIMTANNEIGTIEPIEEILKIIQDKKIFFHTDAVQAIGNLKINLQQLKIDALSLSAHKFFGPKGIGALYIRKGAPLQPIQQGGAQERNRRAGTENTAGIIGMAKALELIYNEDFENRQENIKKLRDYLIEGILNNIEKSFLTGHPQERLNNNASFCFEYIEGESILLNLDMLGIAASSGSACTSASLEPSHVLKALCIPIEISHGSLRLTLGIDTAKEEIDYVISELPKIIKKLRAISPLVQK
ncbi:MAG: cysteine desulfurase NifS [Armatimonadetes bacterium]|nr:cysteine desulfurase NifS [Armatimonadota bacterium]